ncbi:MAG TPA: hydroxymethylbilane synthase [Planctomycetota bacterium]|nr:hydroxymethylbilane synthase [Planctomycetota bacterium]
MNRLTVRVGTRGSALALAQTSMLLRSLESVHPNVNFVVVPIKTAGDRITTVAELRRAGKGLFVKEIERALLANKVSLAIHSMKDLPSEMPKGLVLGAVPERVDPRDVFIGRTATPIGRLAPGSRIATSSLRRQAILKSLYPRLTFVEMKGNLDTRLSKLRAPGSTLAGLIVAAAGVRRLYPDGRIRVQPLPPDQVVPAAGQGVLALQIREGDLAMKKLLAPIHHPPTAACVQAERDLQRRLEGGCQVPLGCYAEVTADGRLTLSACLGTVDGRRLLRARQSGAVDQPLAIAEALETSLVSAGAREILALLAPRRAPKTRAPTKNVRSKR